jgi:calcium-dependent protein kinase
MKTGKKYFWKKIIDFGTAKIFEKNKNEKAVVGSSYYIAPEVLFKNYNEKCDTWSAGVILYMLIVGRAPFDGADDDEIIENIKKGKFNTKHKKLVATSSEVQDLVKKLLEVNVSKRLSAAEALKHPWFKKFDAKSLYKNITEDKIKMYLTRLRKYEINSKFQQMVLAFIVHNLPDSVEKKDILKMFRLFNTTDDGKLSKKDIYNELIKYFDKKEIDETIDDIFLLLDGANRGYIEYEEFLRATIDPKIILSDENLVYAFNFFDRDNTGRISVEKIMSIFVDDKVNEEVFRSIFNEIDTNQDGEIDFQEFKDMMLGN